MSDKALKQKIEKLSSENKQLKRDLSYANSRAQRSEDRYDRDVLGLNNEGDPIGGDPAMGLKGQVEALTKRLNAYEQQPTPPNDHPVGDDPFANYYGRERADLPMGKMTDDELANEAFLGYNQPLDLQGILAGTSYAPIALMTGVKERIRWLSRKLMSACDELQKIKTQNTMAELGAAMDVNGNYIVIPKRVDENG